jgi:A/G-specific adenine glycosylase
MASDFSPRARAAFQQGLLRWFRKHRRELPWRASRDPYRVWVAEIMLQQTRIAAVIPYYERFLSRFPDLPSLANSRQEEVLRLWSGLGYYSRARNLRLAAQEIVTQHEGAFPQSLDAALALPGIGQYTAAAVLSIAYDRPHAVLDGNVARVLARIYAVRGDLREPRRWKNLGRRATELLAQNDAGDWNQALMELGETVCTPQIPRCAICPVSRWCAAHARGLASRIPTPRRKRSPVKVRIAAAVLRDPAGRTLLVRDPGAHDDVLFARMWQFPAVEVVRDVRTELIAHLRDRLALDVAPDSLEALPTARHGVTFRNITLLPFLIDVPHLSPTARQKVLPLASLRRVSISNGTRKIAAAVSGFASEESRARAKRPHR